MIDFPEIAICSKPTDDFPHLSHRIPTKVVFLIFSMKSRNGNWPTESTARLSAELGTRVSSPWTQLPSTPPHPGTFCRNLTLSQLFSNPTTQGKKKIICADFTSYTVHLKNYSVFLQKLAFVTQPSLYFNCNSVLSFPFLQLRHHRGC